MNQIVESGSNTIFTVEMMKKLGVTSADLMFPEVQARLNSVVRFLEKHPDPDLFISRAKMLRYAKDTSEKLRYLDEYAELNQKRTDMEAQLANISKEISVYER